MMSSSFGGHAMAGRARCAVTCVATQSHFREMLCALQAPGGYAVSTTSGDAAAAGGDASGSGAAAALHGADSSAPALNHEAAAAPGPSGAAPAPGAAPQGLGLGLGPSGAAPAHGADPSAVRAAAESTTNDAAVAEAAAFVAACPHFDVIGARACSSDEQVRVRGRANPLQPCPTRRGAVLR